MKRIEIVDANGTLWIGSPGDYTEADESALADLLSNFNELHHIRLEIAGEGVRYFNPAHVVAVSLVKATA